MSQAHYEGILGLLELYQKLGDAEALDAAGEKGITHRDQLPSNNSKDLIRPFLNYQNIRIWVQYLKTIG